MTNRNNLYLVGYASGMAGADSHAGEGPIAVLHSPYIRSMKTIQWDSMLLPERVLDLSLHDAIVSINKQLASRVAGLTKECKKFCVIGGDHSCAIGTWSGVYDAMHTYGDLGLIWIDAHMDSHTPETSDSGRIHGMPLAVLLGHGDASLTSILNKHPKIKPQHLCLIGVRSYEAGEAALLRELNVRIYYIEEVKERGFLTVLREAVAQVKKETYAYGLSIDLDSLDPEEAPGVDVPEKGGIHAADLEQGLSELMQDPELIATEIVEYDPTHDENRKTEKIIVSCLKIMAKAKR